ncbi:MAG: Crp/Fnr family transcriptional regulator [Bacteroidetes bacterium]|nr:Crp/Fnr family transcriptional regulator [Bacteroidota bacterium]
MNHTSSLSLKEKINRLFFLSTPSLDLLLAEAQLISVPKGSLLLKERQTCRSIYFIERGQLRTYYNKNGKDININFYFENNFATNLKSLIEESPSAFYIEAMEHTRLWKFDKEQLLRLYGQSKEIESFGRRLLEKLLVKQEEHSNIFKLYSPKERYHYIAKHYPHLLQRVSLSQLSSYLGISRETISRIRRSSVTSGEWSVMNARW